MRRYMRLLLGAAALLAGAALSLPTAAAPAPAAPAAPAALDPELMGMVIRDPWYDFGTDPGAPGQPNRAFQDRMGATLADMGVRWVRLEFSIESGDVYSTTQVARNDYFINEVAPRYGLKVLGLLSFGLVRDIDPLDPNYGLVATGTITDDLVYGGGVNDYMRTWLHRARLITNRYQGRVAAYEVLNEQNRLPPSGDGVPAYVAARLHTKFFRFFKVNDRAEPAGQPSWRDGVPIIVGGLHPAGTGKPGAPGYISDRQYLGQIYASDGFQSYRQKYGRYPLDGLGYHPYPAEIHVSLQSDIDLIGARMQEMRDLLASPAIDDPLAPFWVTEIGYNAGYPRQNIADQAAFLRAIFTGLGARSDVARIFWFKYEDFPPASGPDAQLWGVVRIPFTVDARCPGGACYAVDGRPDLLRPAYWAYRELAGRPVERVYLPVFMR